jgi:hypothetical protein
MRYFLQPAFLICAAVLAVAAAGITIATKSIGIYMKKEPLPLKKSLDALDERQLAPYKVTLKKKIQNEDIVRELGTEDYIQWVFEDTDASADSPVRRFMLFITYYGLADRVPHVPEECYTGGGYQRMATDSVTLEINKPGFQRTIEGKYLVFGTTKSDFWQSSEKFPVLYFFRVNGQYAGSRDEARIALNKNLFHKFSYFCKVELVFNQTFISPGKEQVIGAGEKLLAVILPNLEREHWPDLQGRINGKEKIE